MERTPLPYRMDGAGNVPIHAGRRLADQQVDRGWCVGIALGGPDEGMAESEPGAHITQLIHDIDDLLGALAGFRDGLRKPGRQRLTWPFDGIRDAHERAAALRGLP